MCPGANAPSLAEFLSPLSRGAAAERVEAAGMHQFARQRVPDDVLRHAADLDQRVEIDAGIDPHLLAQQYQFLGADIARRLRLTGKRTAAEPADGRIELRHPELKCGMSIGDREPPRI